MDNQFNTLTRSYYDNYLQYKLTGNESYQKAYTSAEQGIQSLLKQLQDQVDSQTKSISTFLKSDIEKQLSTTQNEIEETQGKYLTEKNDLITAKMILNAPPSVISKPDYTDYYITMGVLGVAIVGLMAMR